MKHAHDRASNGNATGLTERQVARYKARGMPLTTATAARAWMERTRARTGDHAATGRRRRRHGGQGERLHGGQSRRERAEAELAQIKALEARGALVSGEKVRSELAAASPAYAKPCCRSRRASKPCWRLRPTRRRCTNCSKPSCFEPSPRPLRPTDAARSRRRRAVRRASITLARDLIRTCLAPPPRLTVTEWAEQYRRLAGTERRAGPVPRQPHPIRPRATGLHGPAQRGRRSC